MLRTGTNNEVIGSQMSSSPNQHTHNPGQLGSASSSGSTSHGFDSPKGPAVWRRESASETVRALEKNGMETYDIPAFLRKQAD